MFLGININYYNIQDNSLELELRDRFEIFFHVSRLKTFMLFMLKYLYKHL